MKLFEKAYFIFALLWMARGIIPIATGQGDQRQAIEFDALSFALQFVVFAILAVLMFFHWNSFKAGARTSTALFVICGLAIASAGWSSEPGFALRRAIILLATTMLGIYFASRFDWDEQMSLFGWLAVISIVGSFFMAIFLPDYGISHDVHAGDWKGIFPHKNVLGQQMAFGILVLAVGRPKRLPRGILAVALFGATLLLLLSRSATGVAIVVVMAFIYTTLHLMRLRREKTLPLWLVYSPLIFLGALVVAMNRSAILDILGRSATLTGRTQIWSAVTTAIGEKAWFGYGYSVFWSLGPHGDARNVLAAIHWGGLRQAQSGYLDLCLDLGLIGLIVFIIGFCIAMWRGLKLFRIGSTQADKWPIIFLSFFLIYNLVESSLLQLYTFLWVPYVMVFVSLSLARAAEPLKSESNAESLVSFDSSDLNETGFGPSLAPASEYQSE